MIVESLTVESSPVESPPVEHLRPESLPVEFLPVGSREAAGGRTQPVWLRPPEPGCEVEPTLPTASVRGPGGTRGRGGGRDCAPDLVRLVGAVATECHRARLARAERDVQPFAFSYASRISAGTRPRSLTL